MMVSGKPIGSKQAIDVGLADEMVSESDEFGVDELISEKDLSTITYLFDDSNQYMSALSDIS